MHRLHHSTTRTLAPLGQRLHGSHATVASQSTTLVTAKPITPTRPEPASPAYYESLAASLHRKAEHATTDADYRICDGLAKLAELIAKAMRKSA